MEIAKGPELTSSQRATLDKFKSNVKDLIQPDHDDYYMVKWLRARSWDLPKAEKMFRDDLEWRKNLQFDKLLSSYEPLEVLTKYYPGGLHGVSKEGYPLWFEPITTADQKGFYNCVTKKEILLHKAHEAEKVFRITCPELSKKYGKKIDKAVYIIDLEGLGLKQLWKPAVDVYLEMVANAEAHYPDALHTSYVLNAPSIFPIAYSLVKPFLSEETRKKIRVMGTNYKEHLLKDIDADQLPKHWGGTATDPDGDPYCRSKICMGGTIPEKYYRKKMLEENNDLSKFTQTTVPRGNALQLDFDVDVKNSVLSWNFYTNDNDIGFGIFLRTGNKKQKTSEMEVVVPSERVNSHIIPESGKIQCEKLGTYVVRFDNNYSWVNDKKLFYLVEVIVPDVGKELTVLDSTDF